MRPPPALSQFHRYPVTAGTALLAIAATLAYWGHWKVDPLFADYHILEGQYWRLITSVLPHADVMHLAFNVYWTWVFGTLVEQVLGHVRTLLLFLLFAAMSSGAEFAILSGGIGLSGIGYGLFGLLWVLSARDRRFRDAVDPQTIILFVIWFFVCIALTVSHVMPVANIAHGMGAVAGGVTGYAIAERGAARSQMIALLVALCVAIGLGVSVGRPYVNLSNEGSMDYFDYATDLLDKKQNQQAEVQLKWAIHINPHNAAAWYNLGYAYQEEKRIPDASHAFNRAAQLEPENTQYKDAAAEYPEAGRDQ